MFFCIIRQNRAQSLKDDLFEKWTSIINQNHFFTSKLDSAWMRRDTMAQHDLTHFSGHQGSQLFPVSSRKRPVTRCVLCVFSQTEQKISVEK